MFRDILFDGRSLGKKCIGLEIISVEGGQPEMQSLIFRNLTISLPNLLSILFPPFAIVGIIIWGIEYYLCTKPEEGRRWGDNLAGTKVVDRNPQLADWLVGLASGALLIGMIVIFALLAPNRLLVKQAPNAISESKLSTAQIQKEVLKEFEGKLPMKCDKITTLEQVIAENPNIIKFVYKISNVDSKTLDRKKLTSLLHDAAVKTTRTNSAFKQIVLNGLILRYSYTDDLKKELASFDISKSDL
ncbi:MAG: RDD family protein [Candidatus Riflebacteria bacterium]|nr:RDD family protein [Candidatus Riflebacteria bacterium]